MAFWMSMLTGAAVLDTDTLGRALLRSTEWLAALETDTEGRAFWMSMLTGAADLETDTLAPADLDASTEEIDTLAPAVLAASTLADLENETEGIAFCRSMLTGAAVLEIDTLGRAFWMSMDLVAGAGAAGAAVCDTDRLFFRWPRAAENMPPSLLADADTDAVTGVAWTAL
jgi:hypothetical protein